MSNFTLKGRRLRGERYTFFGSGVKESFFWEGVVCNEEKEYYVWCRKEGHRAWDVGCKDRVARRTRVGVKGLSGGVNAQVWVIESESLTSIDRNPHKRLRFGRGVWVAVGEGSVDIGARGAR